MKYNVLFLILILFNNCCETKNTESNMKVVDNILKEQIGKNKTPGIQYYFFDSESIIYSFKGGYADIKNRKEINDETTYK